jgi:hypothetical protein
MKVLTINSTITCEPERNTPLLHGGKVTLTSAAKLTINSIPTLLRNGILPMSISGCKTVPPPQTQKPCTAVASVAAGEASKLTVNTMPVMLDTIEGTTDGVPTGKLRADAGQSKLTAI